MKYAVTVTITSNFVFGLHKLLMVHYVNDLFLPPPPLYIAESQRSKLHVHTADRIAFRLQRIAKDCFLFNAQHHESLNSAVYWLH